MKKRSLSGCWKLFYMNPQAGLPEDIKKPALTENYMKINVPGDVNAALLKYGKIPDPNYDTQARECYWITSKEWWYVFEFDTTDISEECIELCMKNVDGNANVWLNKTYLGETNNAFRLYRLNVKGCIKKNDNILMIRFKSIDQLLGSPRIDELNGWLGRRAFLRKPQFSFGWDWALPLPSMGLAGDVWIETGNSCRLIDMSVQPFMTGRLDFSFEVTGEAKQKSYEI